jgi:hypothetical protein
MSAGFVSRKTLGAHRLAGVHKRGAHYSSRRGPSCGPLGKRRVLRAGVAGENDSHFEHSRYLSQIVEQALIFPDTTPYAGS